MKQACFRKRTRNKKVTKARSDLVQGFGLAKCGGRSAKRSEADNPYVIY